MKPDNAGCIEDWSNLPIKIAARTSAATNQGGAP